MVHDDSMDHGAGVKKVSRSAGSTKVGRCEGDGRGVCVVCLCLTRRGEQRPHTRGGSNGRTRLTVKCRGNRSPNARARRALCFARTVTQPNVKRHDSLASEMVHDDNMDHGVNSSTAAPPRPGSGKVRARVRPPRLRRPSARGRALSPARARGWFAARHGARFVVTIVAGTGGGGACFRLGAGEDRAARLARVGDDP